MSPRPLQDVPADSLSGLALIQAISSLRSFAGAAIFSKDHLRAARQQRNRLKIRDEIVSKRIDRAVDDVGAPVADADRIAIGRRAGHASDPMLLIADDILDQDRLRPGLEPHPLRYDARNRVGGTPCRIMTMTVIGRDG